MTEISDKDLLDHNYDGIQEYDNPTPGWWTWIFVGTIAFSVVYLLVMFLTGEQLSPQALYQKDYTELLKLQYGELGDVKPDAATILKLSKDTKWVGVGGSIFRSNCISCHGTDGSGMAAPNLTDDNWINVKKVEDIADVVTKGRKNGTMPAWANRLQPVEVVLVSSYVASLRGTNLQSIGGRAKEGEIAPPWTDGSK